MHDLGGADGRQIAIALVRHDDGFGMRALERGGRRRGPSVGYLHVAHVEVVVGEYRAANRTHQDCAVLQAEVGERFGDQLVDDSVSAAGAVVRLLLQFSLAFVAIVERRRFLMNYFVAFHKCLLIPPCRHKRATRTGHPIPGPTCAKKPAR